MPKDPYAILRALVRAESVRNAPKPLPADPGRGTPKPESGQQPPSGKPERG
ncbi:MULTISPECIES: hypothetical protein [Streptomyces]|uniref:hypothetical protein n=1 Tax=Streptomyces TaxID=1883 RepID=UPI00165EDF04|nr:hypothetical protein [Streptomyces apricus]